LFKLLLQILTQLHNLDSKVAAIEDEQEEQTQHQRDNQRANAKALAHIQASLDEQSLVLEKILESVSPPPVGTVSTQKFVFGTPQ
jgi:hypothetical protein